MTDAIEEAELSGKDYIVSGFPRTRVQALALQKMKIIPNKFIVVTCDKKETMKGFYVDTGESTYHAHKTGLDDVVQIFKHLVFSYHATGKELTEPGKHFVRMLKLTD